LFVFDDPVTKAAYGKFMTSGKPVTEPVSTLVVYLPARGDYRAEPRLALITTTCTEQSMGAVSMRLLRLLPESRIEDVLDTAWPDLEPDAIDTRWDHEDEMRGAGADFFRIVVNAILYLNSAEPEQQTSERPRISGGGSVTSGSRGASALPAVTYIMVGGTVPPLRIGEGGEGARRQLTSRQFVRGFWRRQVHGPGRTLRKLMYVEPFWRGPDTAEVISRPYVVKLRDDVDAE
jgi:hypothetical protein